MSVGGTNATEGRMDPIDITGIDKAQLLAALHNGTRPLGMGILQARPDITAAEAAGFIAERKAKGVPDSALWNFDYFYGRPLKVNIGGDQLFPRLYDRDAGAGAAARVVARLRAAQ